MPPQPAGGLSASERDVCALRVGADLTATARAAALLDVDDVDDPRLPEVAEALRSAASGSLAGDPTERERLVAALDRLDAVCPVD